MSIEELKVEDFEEKYPEVAGVINGTISGGYVIVITAEKESKLLDELSYYGNCEKLHIGRLSDGRYISVIDLNNCEMGDREIEPALEDMDIEM